MKKVSLVIPSFNEEGNLHKLSEEILNALKEFEVELIFVDDGSTDETFRILQDLAGKSPQVRFISFTRNFGHQAALKAGVSYASGDCVIMMDADFQHPVSLLPEMLRFWKEGYKVVSTRRIDGKGSGVFKELSSRLFYAVLNSLSDTKIPYGQADFRLVDRTVADIIKLNNEAGIFIRGLIPWMGFEEAVIPFNVQRRAWGKPRFTMGKMIKFSMQGVTSFSNRPLKIASFIGLLISVGAFVYSLYVIYISAFTDTAIPGWASVLLSVLFIGGIQLLFLGVLGEYLGKVFNQTKSRPTYIIKAIDQRLTG